MKAIGSSSWRDTSASAPAASRQGGSVATDERPSFARILADRSAVPELDWVQGEEDRLRWAAAQLEAVLLRDLLDEALQPGKSSFWGKGPGVEVYSSLFLDEISQELARTGQFGVADMLVNQLQPQGQGQEQGQKSQLQPEGQRQE